MYQTSTNDNCYGGKDRKVIAGRWDRVYLEIDNGVEITVQFLENKRIMVSATNNKLLPNQWLIVEPSHSDDIILRQEESGRR